MVTAYERLWIFSDEFGSRSFDQFYLSRMSADCYIKTHFDITSYTNNMFSENPSVIGRLGNLVKNALDNSMFNKKRIPLPKMIVVVPDDDIIKCLKEISQDVSKSMSRLVNYIMTEHERNIASFKAGLPAKCKKEGYPHILWILAPMHVNYPNNADRYKFNKAVEDMAKVHTNISSLELKKVWNERDDGLYIKEQQRYTTDGLKSYWEAVDKTVRYCDSVILKRKMTTKKFKPNLGQNDQFRWHNPMSRNFPLENYQEFRKLPTPPRRR